MAGFRAPVLIMCLTALNSRQFLIKYQITSHLYYLKQCSTLKLPGKKCKRIQEKMLVRWLHVSAFTENEEARHHGRAP